jgi:hypothetical protein
LDVVTESLRVAFVVGIVAIPILYWFSGSRSAGRDQNRAQNEDGRVEHEARSTAHRPDRVSTNPRKEEVAGERDVDA